MKRLALECSIGTPDKKRLTDEGLLDFIEDSVAQSKIENLDLREALSCSITVESIFSLKKLTNLKNLSVNEEQLKSMHPFKFYEESESYKAKVNNQIEKLCINCDPLRFGFEKAKGDNQFIFLLPLF